jgi:hypothetical protein
MCCMDIADLLKSSLALFAIVDPVGVIPLFLVAIHGCTLAQSRSAPRQYRDTSCHVPDGLDHRGHFN